MIFEGFRYKRLGGVSVRPVRFKAILQICVAHLDATDIGAQCSRQRRQVGVSLLSFVPTYMTKYHHRKDEKCF